jgi:hypothetical protein
VKRSERRLTRRRNPRASTALRGRRSRGRERREVGDWARCTPSLLRPSSSTLAPAPTRPTIRNPRPSRSAPPIPAAVKAKEERQGRIPRRRMHPSSSSSRPSSSASAAPHPHSDKRAPPRVQPVASPARRTKRRGGVRLPSAPARPHHAPRHRCRLGHGSIRHHPRTCSTPEERGLAPPRSPARVKSTDARCEAFVKCLPSGEEARARKEKTEIGPGSSQGVQGEDSDEGERGGRDTKGPRLTGRSAYGHLDLHPVCRRLAGGWNAHSDSAMSTSAV